MCVVGALVRSFLPWCTGWQLSHCCGYVERAASFPGETYRTRIRLWDLPLTSPWRNQCSLTKVGQNSSEWMGCRRKGGPDPSLSSCSHTHYFLPVEGPPSAFLPCSLAAVKPLPGAGTKLFEPSSHQNCGPNKPLYFISYLAPGILLQQHKMDWDICSWKKFLAIWGGIKKRRDFLSFNHMHIAASETFVYFLHGLHIYICVCMCELWIYEVLQNVHENSCNEKIVNELKMFCNKIDLSFHSILHESFEVSSLLWALYNTHIFQVAR